MRNCIFAILTVVGAFAHAAEIECSNASNSSGLIYSAEKMTVSILLLNGTAVGTSDDLAISGEITGRPGAAEGQMIFTYPLANGQSMEITWLSRETEIIRKLRGEALSAELKDSNGRVVDTYRTCKWTDTN